MFLHLVFEVQVQSRKLFTGLKKILVLFLIWIFRKIFYA